MDSIMQLARSIVNDTFPGIAGAQGRILTNDAPFTLPYFNEALRQTQRKLRNEGVKFPIKENVILVDLTPIVTIDPAVQVFVSYNGYFDGTVMHASPQLPNDFVQPITVEERQTGSNLPFGGMEQPQGGLPSLFQSNWFRVWSWVNYQLRFPGSIQAKDIRLRYRSGQPPLNVLPAQFATTVVNILDCESAMANFIAKLYAQARGAADITMLETAFEDAISEMALEYVRQQQSVNIRRPPYGGGGSGSQGNTNTGQSGWGS
jgi:hypothetical protein